MNWGLDFLRWLTGREDIPILTGKDAENFLKSMNGAVMTPERLRYLQGAAEASKKATQRCPTCQGSQKRDTGINWCCENAFHN